MESSPDKTLRRRFEITKREIGQKQRRQQIDGKKRAAIKRNWTLRERKAQHDHELERKVQKEARIGHVAGGLDYAVQQSRHSDLPRQTKQQDRRIADK